MVCASATGRPSETSAPPCIENRRAPAESAPPAGWLGPDRLPGGPGAYRLLGGRGLDALIGGAGRNVRIQ